MVTPPIRDYRAIIGMIRASSAIWLPISSCHGAIALFRDEALALGTYHGLRRKHVDVYLNEFVFRYNRRYYRHVSFETVLGLAAHRKPETYWDTSNATIRANRQFAPTY